MKLRGLIVIITLTICFVSIATILKFMKSDDSDIRRGVKLTYPDEAKQLFEKSYEANALNECTKFIVRAAELKNTGLLFQSKVIDTNLRDAIRVFTSGSKQKNSESLHAQFAKVLNENRNTYYDDCRKTYYEILFACKHRSLDDAATSQCFVNAVQNSKTVEELESSTLSKRASLDELMPSPPAKPPKCANINKGDWLVTYQKCFSGPEGNMSQLVEIRAVTARQLVTFCECMTTTVTYDLSCEDDKKAQTDDEFSERLFQERFKVCGTKAALPYHPLLSDQ